MLIFHHLFDPVVKIVDIPDLAGYCDSFRIISSNFAVILECFKGVQTLARPDEIAADHHACSALACFAVDTSNIFYTFY